VRLEAALLAPPTPGTYLVEWDGVEESVTWFSWAGTPAGQTYLTVVGSPALASLTAQPQSFTGPPSLGAQPPVGRLTQWRIALRMARNRPLLGVGPDNFRWVYGSFAQVKTWDTGAHANSLYFEWLADTGVLGLGAFLWLAGATVMTAARSVRQVDAHSLWRLGLLASLAAWLLHGTLDYFYEPLSTNAAFWLVAALVLAAAESGTQACESAST
jgi:O-antigen ligase